MIIMNLFARNSFVGIRQPALHRSRPRPTRSSSRLQAVLPRMAERTVTAVTVEVPSYTRAFSGRMGQTIENAVQMALGAFLRLAVRAARLRSGRDAVARPRRGLRAGSRRGPPGPLHGRAAVGLPRRRPGRLAGVVGHRRRRRTGRRHRGPVRRVGVRVHRRAVGVQRRRDTPTSWPPRDGSASATSSGWPSSCSPASPPRRCGPAPRRRTGTHRRR